MALSQDDRKRAVALVMIAAAVVVIIFLVLHNKNQLFPPLNVQAPKIPPLPPMEIPNVYGDTGGNQYQAYGLNPTGDGVNGGCGGCGFG